ncbi:tripartite tricarboxylate transporter permease [Pararhodobacter sp. CCB-MM2]|uniref:tripartite tricarboxylate transporter permease n=1 Tax=Pararhodobacter sp. CCB-MM2 TaxID=1786003 RepID=UPI00082E30B4|nr:tripartite tricarboxylate transporter permease [Pararhodobacter sp. CCB-MM2]MCA2013607.1 tripartite tricarboxylate transporter permease [Cereibacter sphaeroides]
MDLILLGFSVLLQPSVLMMLVLGVFVGLVVGSIPGINDNIAFAVFIPFSFSLPVEQALALMVGVYCAAATGGAIPAIMLRVPGTAAALLTTLDGNAMARRGHAGRALSIAMTSSVVGGILSALVLLICAPLLAQVALRFGYVENAALTVLGLSCVVGLLKNNILKGVISAALGLLVAMVGFSQSTGFPRYTFGNVNLIEGIPFVPLLVGLFGVAAALELMRDIVKERGDESAQTGLPKIGSMRLEGSLLRRLMPTWLTASAIGNFIGVLPGAGMLMAIYLAYDQAARRFRRRFAGQPGEPEWGQGTPEGIAAPEAANNSVTASSMVPLLSLGIPGNSTSALFIGAMALHGLVPGPLLFTQNSGIAWMIIVAFLACNLVMWPLAFVVIRLVSGTVFAIPRSVMVGVILLLCVLGAYSDGNNLFNVWVALVAGVVAYVMNRAGIPLGPAILGLVLGAQMEASFANSLLIARGDWLVFIDPVAHPISAAMIAVSALMWLAPMLGSLGRRIAKAR